MKIFIPLLMLAAPLVTAIDLSEVHPGCNYMECAPVEYEELLDADKNIYSTIINRLIRARVDVPVCDVEDVKEIGYPKISKYFTKNGYDETLPFQILNQLNEPKPDECSKNSDSDSDEDDLSFPCCQFNFTVQIVLPSDVSEPAEPDEGSGVYLIPWPFEPEITGQAFAIVFDDSDDFEDVIEKWNELKTFLINLGLVPWPDYFNFADFSHPNAPETNRYWVLTGVTPGGPQ